jgi:hypothetical protein
MLGAERGLTDGCDRDDPRSTRLDPDDGTLEPLRERMIGSDALRSLLGVEWSTRLGSRSGKLRVAESVRERLGVALRVEPRTSPERFTREGEESAPGVRVTPEGVRTLPVEPRAGSPARRQPPLSGLLDRTPLLERTLPAAPPLAEEGVERTEEPRSAPRTPSALVAAAGLLRKSRTEVASWFRCWSNDPRPGRALAVRTSPPREKVRTLADLAAIDESLRAERLTTCPRLPRSGTTGIWPRIRLARCSSSPRRLRGLLSWPREKPLASTTVTPLLMRALR